MDRTGWAGLAQYVISGAPPGWGGMWSVLFSAERATSALCQVVPAGWAISLYDVGEQLRTACDNLAMDHPGEVAAAGAIDLGPVLHPDGVLDAVHVLGRLLQHAIELADDVLDGPDLDLLERMALTVLTCDLTAAASTLAGSRR